MRSPYLPEYDGPAAGATTTNGSYMDVGRVPEPGEFRIDLSPPDSEAVKEARAGARLTTMIAKTKTAVTSARADEDLSNADWIKNEIAESERRREEYARRLGVHEAAMNRPAPMEKTTHAATIGESLAGVAAGFMGVPADQAANVVYKLASDRDRVGFENAMREWGVDRERATRAYDALQRKMDAEDEFQRALGLQTHKERLDAAKDARDFEQSLELEKLRQTGRLDKSGADAMFRLYNDQRADAGDRENARRALVAAGYEDPGPVVAKTPTVAGIEAGTNLRDANADRVRTLTPKMVAQIEADIESKLANVANKEAATAKIVQEVAFFDETKQIRIAKIKSEVARINAGIATANARTAQVNAGGSGRPGAMPGSLPGKPMNASMMAEQRRRYSALVDMYEAEGEAIAAELAKAIGDMATDPAGSQGRVVELQRQAMQVGAGLAAARKGMRQMLEAANPVVPDGAGPGLTGPIGGGRKAPFVPNPPKSSVAPKRGKTRSGNSYEVVG